MEVDSGEGRKTIGRYEITKVLGRGAMGVVYKARDPLLDRIVAVKTIVSPQGAGKRVRSAYLERFQREAKAAAKMQHPAIVTIFDVGVDEEWGAPFMVLEYLPGESLADRLDRVRMPLGRAVSIASDLASALAFAHRQRIVHRDVKPANVLHAGEQRWKLADFGIARLPDSELTQVGIFMGTPGYSPPEAIREGRYTPQADVFAWGALLYELLSGRIPYEGPDTRTTNSHVVKGDCVPPTHHDRTIPKPLSDVCMRALEPDVARRLKDGDDAERTLRTAWEKALTSGLVSPAALAGDEIPHERVTGGTMHGHVTRPPDQATSAPPPATSQGEFDGATTVESEPPPMTQTDATDGGATRRGDPSTAARPAGKAGKRDRDKAAAKEPVLVIEGSGPARAGDDAPTRIYREDSRQNPAVRPKRPTGRNQLEGQAKEDAARAAKEASSEVREDASDSRNWRLALLVLALLGALALAWVFYGP
jgi:serine/threonine-protein kinase